MERESPALLRMAEDGDTAAVVLDPFGEGTEMLVILLQSLRDGFMAEFTIAGPKDSCADLDCIRIAGARPYRIESYCGAREW